MSLGQRFSVLLSEGYRRFVLGMLNERGRQIKKFGPQREIPCVPDDWSPEETPGGRVIAREHMAKAACDAAFAEGKGTWAHIMLEEAAEVIDAADDGARCEELVQLATVCMAWVEAIEARTVRIHTSSGPGEIT